MAGNRKAATEFILTHLEKLLPGGGNSALYETYYAGMSDAQFDAYMGRLANGEEPLIMIAPILAKARLSTERNLKLAKELGHNFYQRLWLKNPHGGGHYLTPIEYLVVDWPLGRQAQLQTKKISIAEDNSSVDDYSGQPTGKSQGSKLSYPELQILAAMGLDYNIVEMMKFRGGDSKAFDAQNRQISDTGTTSQESIEHLGGHVTSKQTFGTLFTCMHIDHTLMKE